MQSLFSLRNAGLALAALLLTGCTELNTGWNPAAPQYPEPYAQSDFDELLAFGANMSKLSPSARADSCHTLLKRQKDVPGPGIQLHLLVGRLQSEACGDIGKILSAINTQPPGSLPDIRVQRLVDIHVEALKRMQNASRKSALLERKQKSVQSVLESKDAKETGGSNKNEARMLREKLEAIRSMEKHLDETGDAN